MKKTEIAKRYILFIISLFVSGVGVAFTKTGALGVSPISSVANVLSLRFTDITIGNWLIITNCLMVLGQILILRKSFKPIQLLQIPLSFLFGYFTDIGMIIAGIVPVNSYPMQLVMVVSGVVILGFGIALAVIANVIMNAGEAFVKAIADTLHKNFGNVKVVFDISYVAFSIVLSMLLFNGSIEGTREGTLIAAVCTGFTVKFFTKLLKKRLNKLLTK
ncbi:MAG: YitT family protein [Clostridia bacterium]|nr:YitT family protein [Clostridia bacterium]